MQREGHSVLVGMDEVGRGALAGPVSVGVVAIDPSCRSAPSGVRDSKLLTPAARTAMVPRIRRWALAYGVGHASPAEIDSVGIMAALRLAGTRAMGQLAAAGVRPDLVLLDGNHDWLTEPARVGLFAFTDETEGAADGPQLPPVRTMIKADLTCSSVAAASVLAKVERDAAMVALAAEFDAAASDRPDYGWAVNKGYAAPGHLATLRQYGPSIQHRRSWNLTGGANPADAKELS